jgi:oligopeptide/dipeptide ABC transporter ATP-binding protein
MRQRVMIAMAVCANPDVLIADEPTTALDVTTQARIMDLLTRLVEERRMAVLLITHDLGLAASFCDDVHVMYGGRIVERGTAAEVFRSPLHPYTEALLESICRLDRPLDEPITAIGGQPPVPEHLPGGCSFHPRCPHAQARCTAEAPVPIQVGDQMAECHFAVELEAARS